MGKSFSPIEVINNRIYKELNIIEEERSKSCQMGSVIDRSTAIAMEMNVLRKALEGKDSQLKNAEFRVTSAEERSEYLEERLKEVKEELKDAKKEN